MGIMKKLLFLIVFFISYTYIANAQSATYVVSVGHKENGTLSLVLPTGITTSDIQWSIELQVKGETCSKGSADQPPKWMVNSTNDGDVQAFQLNMSIFSGCSMSGRPAGWTAGDEIVLKMKINKAGHEYNGAEASCSMIAQGGMNAGMKEQGIVFEKPVVVPTIKVTGVTLCQGVTGKKVNATVTNAPTGYSIDWGNANITTDRKSVV